MPGDYYVTKNEEEITTVLGSCVSFCIKDTENYVGGMNHYIYPKSNPENNNGIPDSCYGDLSIGLLMDNYQNQGGKLDKIEIMLYGEGKILSGQSNVGEQNIEVAQKYLAENNMTVSASDVGGQFSRKITFYPKTGEVRMRKLSAAHNKFIASKEGSV